jgi:hypothetical protein
MNKKILTIHSEDRDINKWSNPNEFEVLLPDSYTNINSIKLLNFTGKNNFYNISEKLLNNYIALKQTNILELDFFLIPDGFYDPDQLALVLTNLFKKGSYHIYVLYDRVKMKFLFLSTTSGYILDFTILPHNGELCSDLNKFIKPDNIGNQYTNWGIGYNLGFTKDTYEISNNNVQIDSDTNTHYVNDFDFSLNNKNNFNLQDILLQPSYHYLYSSNTIDLNINNTIYMEIDKYNYADEIMPYQYRSNYLYCNDYNSSINSFFAKIILDDDPNNKNTYFFESRENGNIVFGDLINENKIQKLMKLKFKFRYHNQTLVDFNNQNFNFTLEIEKDSNIKKY